mmetsp:Transcript_10614/g.24974  ORF Transcript_10614/g.24974 Transcript_10614/m.24974 type:complete len:159 (+) Transcript_10614:99-575(+)
MNGAEPRTRSTGPIDHSARLVWLVPLASFFPFAQAGMPQQAIAATHMNVVPPLGLVLPKPAHLVLYVPGLHLLVVLESSSSPPLFVLLIFRRLIALAADSGMSSSIYRPSTPTLLIPEKYPSSDLGDTHKKKEAVVDNTTHIFKRRMVYVKGLGLCLG